jgi:hypothetical protein
MTMKHLRQTGVPTLRRLAVVLTAASTLSGLATGTLPGRSAVKRAEDVNERWVATWSTALHAPDTVVFGTNPGFENQTFAPGGAHERGRRSGTRAAVHVRNRRRDDRSSADRSPRFGFCNRSRVGP